MGERRERNHLSALYAVFSEEEWLACKEEPSNCRAVLSFAVSWFDVPKTLTVVADKLEKKKKQQKTGAGLYLKFPLETQGNAVIQVDSIYFYHL